MDIERFKTVAIDQLGILMKNGQLSQEEGAAFWFGIIPAASNRFIEQINALDPENKNVIDELYRWMLTESIV